MALGDRGTQNAADDVYIDGPQGKTSFPPGKANNTARSLQIISVQQGWDPREIIGEVYKPRQSQFGLSDTAYGYDQMCANDAQANQSVDAQNPDWNRPDVSREKPTRTRGASPFPAMPGSGGS